MATPSLGSAEFVLGYCDTCNKDVLTHIDVDDRGDETRRCLHCDAPITAALRTVGASELEATGYALVEARGCGGGGGCGAGGCGMRQPS